MFLHHGNRRGKPGLLALNISELTLKLLAATVQDRELGTDRRKNSLQIKHRNLRKTRERTRRTEGRHSGTDGCRVWRCGWRQAQTQA